MTQLSTGYLLLLLLYILVHFAEGNRQRLDDSATDSWLLFNFLLFTRMSLVFATCEGVS